MAEAHIGGVTTLLVFDTGADTHLVTDSVAAALGLSGDPSQEGRDGSGASVASAFVGSLEAEIGGTMWTLRDVIGIPSPAGFDALGIGGFVSPQRLSDVGVVLDLARDLLVETDASASDGVPLRGRAGLLTLEVVIGDRRPVLGFVDTGSATTDVTAAAAGLNAAPRRSSGRGVSGETIESTTTSLALSLGGTAPTLCEVEVRDEIPGPPEVEADGGFGALVGMDLLAGSVLAIRPSGPSSWSPRALSQ